MGKREGKEIQEVLERYRGYIYGCLLACRRTEANAYYNGEDAYQEVLLRLIQGLEGYDPGKGSFDSYIRGLIYRTAKEGEAKHFNASMRGRKSEGNIWKGKMISFGSLEEAGPQKGPDMREEEFPSCVLEELSCRSYSGELREVLSLIAEGYSLREARQEVAERSGVAAKELYREYWRFAMNCRNRRKREETGQGRPR